MPNNWKVQLALEDQAPIPKMDAHCTVMNKSSYSLEATNLARGLNFADSVCRVEASTATSHPGQQKRSAMKWHAF
jgi:hypothetical protein